MSKGSNRHCPPLHFAGDPPAMTEAIKWARAERIYITRPSQWQLKVGDINFYPKTGTVQLDRMSREPVQGEAGLKLFKELASRRTAYLSRKKPPTMDQTLHSLAGNDN